MGTERSTFVRNLKRLMCERGMTQAELGKAIGVSQGHVSMFATGKREPKVTSIVRIARALGVSTDELLGE